MIDIHSHILYGVDDGSKNIDESFRMIQIAKNIGVTKIVATPHIRNTKVNLDIIKITHKTLCEEAIKTGVSILLGYEVHIDVVSENSIEALKNYCIENTNKILIELNINVYPYNLEKTIMDLQREGLSIIIAHPERYLYIQNNIARAKRLVDLGCELQVDCVSLKKCFFNKQKKCAISLIRNNLVKWIASDAHNEQDYLIFGKIISKFKISRI